MTSKFLFKFFFALNDVIIVHEMLLFVHVHVLIIVLMCIIHHRGTSNYYQLIAPWDDVLDFGQHWFR